MTKYKGVKKPHDLDGFTAAGFIWPVKDIDGPDMFQRTSL